MIGKTISRYHVEERIGSGGMGTVYRARDERLSRNVALKVLPAGTVADDVARQRFRQEALALSQLNHPNIATIHDFDTQDGVDFLVMEHIDGSPLDDLLSAGPMPEKEVIAIGSQIAQGLSAAHNQGVVHRDLKPSNVRLTGDGRVKILDFGLAKLLHPSSDISLTQSGSSSTAAGTLPYMAPEQLREEKVDSRADIYALGAVLYELSTGQRPFPETRGALLIESILYRQPLEPRVLNRRISPGLQQIIMKALDKNPDQRYQSARELQVDLERLRIATESGMSIPLGARRARLSAKMRAAIAVAIVAVTLAAYWGWRVLRTNRAPRSIVSVAVLPLENTAPGTEEEIFAEGMTEALTTNLGKISSLQVMPHAALVNYKRGDKNLAQVGAELKVDGLIAGNVLHTGDQVRITVELILASTGALLWSDSYQGNAADILSLQNQAAQAIAEKIKGQLSPQEQAQFQAARPVNPDAHLDYVRGRYHWNRRSGEGLVKAIDSFEQAIRKDPNYAVAYVGLADAYLVRWGRGDMPPAEAYAKAKAAAQKALELDPTMGEAHASLGHLNSFNYEWEEADKQFRRAIELSPGYATAHHWYALQLSALGRHAEAIQYMETAQKLEHLNLIINANVGWCYYMARRYDDAIAQQRRTLELDPNYPAAHAYMGQAYIAKGLFEPGIAALQRAVSASSEDPRLRAELAYAYARAGQHEKARAILGELIAASDARPVPAYHIAMVYTGLGEIASALQWLERSHRQRDARIVNINVHPAFEPLRGEPRFQKLVRELDLAR